MPTPRITDDDKKRIQKFLDAPQDVQQTYLEYLRRDYQEQLNIDIAYFAEKGTPLIIKPLCVVPCVVVSTTAIGGHAYCQNCGNIRNDFESWFIRRAQLYLKCPTWK